MTEKELYEAEEQYKYDCYPRYVVRYDIDESTDYEIITDVTTLEYELVQGGRLCNLRYAILHGDTYSLYGLRYVAFLKCAFAYIVKDVINATFSSFGVKVSFEFAMDLLLNEIDVCIKGVQISAKQYDVENNHIKLAIYFNNKLHKEWLIW